MKRNAIMEKARELITPEIREDVDFALAIVNRIFDILEKNNISQRELAKRLKKNETEISRWMQGTHNFTLSTIRKIERALNEPILIVAGNKLPYNKYQTLAFNNTFALDNNRQSYSQSTEITIVQDGNLFIGNNAYQC